MSYMEAPRPAAGVYQGRHAGVIRRWNGGHGVIAPSLRWSGWRPIPFTVNDVIGGKAAEGRSCAYSVRRGPDGEPCAVGVRVHKARQ